MAKVILDPMESMGLLGAILAGMHSAKRRRPSVQTLTPEQEARRAVRQERAAWNAAVEQRKAAKLAAKGRA